LFTSLKNPTLKNIIFFLLLLTLNNSLFAQDKLIDTTSVPEIVNIDSVLRITNLNPFFTIHVDSILNYELNINKDPKKYYWYLKKAPVGLKIDKSTGTVYFKAEKMYFLSGRLKYDQPYKIEFGVQNLKDPNDKVDTSLSILFYSTEINLSKVKPAVYGTLQAEEGDTVRFRVQCEGGTFPIEQINFNSNIPISIEKPLNKCEQDFIWMVPFDFIKDNDTSRQKILTLEFIGYDKFFNKDTALVKIAVKPGINYPQRNLEHKMVSQELKSYIQNLKLTFYVVSKNIKTNKTTRTAFDITGSTTALAGTVLTSTGATESAKSFGKILPSIGLTLVPVKEAVSPNRIQEQNTASQIRTITKRLDYLLSDNQLIGSRDVDVIQKTKKLNEELKQARLQFIDLPMVEFDDRINQNLADKYFNDPRVIRKYKLKVN
jgi:hypothetical protein